MNEELIDLLCEKSFRYDENFGFTLASGKKSDVYVDVKKTVLSPKGMDLIGRAFYEKIKNIDFDGVGGLTLGADPIAYTTASVCYKKGKEAEVFIVRKEVKEHGTRLPIEGNLTEGARVVVVEDVVTTGGSALKAIEACKSAGFKIVAVISVVDRQEGGRENILKDLDCPFIALTTKEELIKKYKEINP